MSAASGGAERGDEDGLGLQVRIGLDAVGTLDEGVPKAGFQEEVLDGVRIGGDLRAEVRVGLLGVGLHQDGQELSLLTPDDAAHRTADRRGDEDPGILLVGHDRGTGENTVALLHEESRKEPFEISGLYGDGSRFDGLGDFPGGGTLYRNVEALFQIEMVGHYDNSYLCISVNTREFTHFFAIFVQNLEEV